MNREAQDFDPIATEMRIVVVDSTCWQKDDLLTSLPVESRALTSQCKFEEAAAQCDFHRIA